jgi:hypothetical protein
VRGTGMRRGGGLAAMALGFLPGLIEIWWVPLLVRAWWLLWLSLPCEWSFRLWAGRLLLLLRCGRGVGEVRLRKAASGDATRRSWFWSSRCEVLQ